MMTVREYVRLDAPHADVALSLFVPLSGEKRPKQEEEGREEAGMHGELRPDARYGADDREGPQGPPGDVPLPLSAGEIHYGECSVCVFGFQTDITV